MAPEQQKLEGVAAPPDGVHRTPSTHARLGSLAEVHGWPGPAYRSRGRHSAAGRAGTAGCAGGAAAAPPQRAPQRAQRLTRMSTTGMKLAREASSTSGPRKRRGSPLLSATQCLWPVLRHDMKRPGFTCGRRRAHGASVCRPGRRQGQSSDTGCAGLLPVSALAHTPRPVRLPAVAACRPRPTSWRVSSPVASSTSTTSPPPDR